MTLQSRLLQLLADPDVGRSFGAHEWVEAIRSARHGNLLPRVALVVEEQPWAASVPHEIRQQLAGARPIAAQHERIIRWEVGRIAEALRGLEPRLVLLKGAAYVMAGLPAGRGRLATDVDVLVPADRLTVVEQALLAAGWTAMKLHPYDQRFYRQWSHELPPLQHSRRGSVVDVHHTILPLTGRLHPDPAALLEAAVPADRSTDETGLTTRTSNGDRPSPAIWTLAPEDMVLHTSVHLFQDGELAGGIRDLVDIDSLLRDFGGRVAGFWDRLVPRARQLGLERPLFYALRYARRMLQTPVPDPVMSAVAAARPAAPVLALMDRLVDRSLLPVGGRPAGLGEESARLLLYTRSHWLRMPPGQLAAHLVRKVGRRWFDSDQA